MYFTVNTPLLNSMNACKMNVQVVMINKKQMVKGFRSSCSPLRATLVYRDLPNLMWHLWVPTTLCITAAGTETLVVRPTVARQTMIYMSSEWGWGTLIWKTLQSQRKAIKKWGLTVLRSHAGLNFKALSVCPGRVRWRNEFICCNQNIIQSKRNSLKWLECDSTEVTLAVDALHHPASWDIGVKCQRCVTGFPSSCHYDTFSSIAANSGHIFQPKSEFCLLDAIKNTFSALVEEG